MVSASEIRDQVAKLLFGEISLQEFEDWFVPATWDAHKAGDAEAENLTDEIDMSLSEYTSRQLSPEQLRSGLAGAVFPLAKNRFGDPIPSPVPESNATSALNVGA
jgi:hypothetical protein